MSKMRRGNTVRPSAGPRVSNVRGFSAYPETLRPAQPPDGAPPPEETTAAPPPVVLNGSAVAKATSADSVPPPAEAAEEKAPDSGARSKDDPALAKAEVPEKLDAPAPPAEAEPAKPAEPAKAENGKAAARMRADKPDKPERRARERKGRGKSAAPPSVVAKDEARAPEDAKDGREVKTEEPQAKKEPDEAKKHAESDKDGAESAAHGDKPATGHADIDERFFAEGVDSEQQMLRDAVTAKSSRGGMAIDEEIDPKILLKLQPEVQARRAKFFSYLTATVLLAVGILMVGLYMRHQKEETSEESAKREMAEYAAAHTYTDPTPPPPPASAAQPTATAGAAASAVASAAPADSTAVAAPADSASAAAADKGPLGAEAKTAASAAPATSGAAPGAQQVDTETPPAKTAQQEKRDAQNFLDRGAFARAAEAAQRSVGLDSSDAEAWLLLGAAYQSMGRAGEAKRAFSSCLSQGKRGPIGECKAMMQ